MNYFLGVPKYWVALAAAQSAPPFNPPLTKMCLAVEA